MSEITIKDIATSAGVSISTVSRDNKWKLSS